MTIEKIEADLMTYAQVKAETGASYSDVKNWMNYHKYMEKFFLHGKPFILRTEFERFKREHPELIKAKKAVTP